MSPAPGLPSKVLTQPRPGHADLAGMLKYGLRRRPGRPRAGVGPRDGGPGGGRHRGQAAAGPDRGRRPQPHRPAGRGQGPPGAAARARPTSPRIDASQVRCFDPEAEARMVAAIKAAAKAGDSLGGVAEVLAYGVPVGLGSHVHWDRRLDALLAQALMSIQAVKAVEIGEGGRGGRPARLRGPRRHPRGDPDADAEAVPTGGATCATPTGPGASRAACAPGAPIVARLSMKPLATLNRPDARHGRRGHQGVDGLVQGAHRRDRGAGHGRRGRDDDGPRAGRRGAAQVRRRLASTSSCATTPATWPPWARPRRRRRRSAMADRLVLVGMMGAGQDHGRSGAGGAARLAVPRLRRRCRGGDRFRPWPELFAERGEAAFRAEESRVLAEALAGGGRAVVSAAGGAVLDPANRELLATADGVVWLRAAPATLAARVGDGAGRRCWRTTRPPRWPGSTPSAGPTTARWPTWSSTSTTSTPSTVVDRILAATAFARSAIVTTGRSPWRWRSAPTRSGGRRGASRAGPAWSPRPSRTPDGAVVVDPGGDRGRRSTPGCPPRSSPSPTASRPSRWPQWRTCAAGFARAGLSRADVVVAVGGGVVTDLAGFAAASFHRGTAYVNVATSLLAQVDAAIGGKTGVNLPEGKNLVGAFWQPRGRPVRHRGPRHPAAREWASGRGEIAKYALLGDRHRSAARPRRTSRSTSRWPAAWPSRRRSWPSDEREGDRRMLLNYGHTLAHALEAAAFADDPARPAPRRGGGRRPGLRRAAGPAARADRRRPGGPPPAGGRRLRPRHRTCRRAPTPRSCSTFMGRDKKAHGDLTFVLDGPRGVEVGPWRRPGRRGRYPGGHGVDRPGRHEQSGGRR